MRDKSITREFYCQLLGFRDIGSFDFPDYLILKRELVELHFFLFSGLNPEENYGQVYLRVERIQELYESLIASGVNIHPNGKLLKKPWGQWEFALLDPDNNLLTFGSQQ